MSSIKMFHMKAEEQMVDWLLAEEGRDLYLLILSFSPIQLFF